MKLIDMPRGVEAAQPRLARLHKGGRIHAHRTAVRSMALWKREPSERTSCGLARTRTSWSLLTSFYRGEWVDWVYVSTRVGFESAEALLTVLSSAFQEF